MKNVTPCACRVLLVAAGILSLHLTILAQVPNTNVNAVGYLNVSVLPGFNLVSNQLRYSPAYTVADLAGSLQGNVPDGLSVYLLFPEGYRSATYDTSSRTFEPADIAAEELSPGRGFFLFNPATNALTLTFVGEFMQGTLTNNVPAGFSLVASMVPQEATLALLGFPTEPGDVVYRFNPLTQTFVAAVFDDIDGAWMPGIPQVYAGEAFVVFKNRPATWTRTFFANP